MAYDKNGTHIERGDFVWVDPNLDNPEEAALNGFYARVSSTAANDANYIVVKLVDNQIDMKKISNVKGMVSRTSIRKCTTLQKITDQETLVEIKLMYIQG